ncbi:tryptophan halogenase family protein [Scleromatobacter humisilvae]|uniref:Tryptophan 7-halogenase n=1 Tax=Scleromatobacter humisilvae TaxID=2897159 RepID=A0A9X1YMJ4_9BURK|nr:tryptophan halogenase family protein [Scleromatobacter humisilvae]MCK9687538.1 tryptophan 7-halogenase [Scleromatobacter humisilvae]
MQNSLAEPPVKHIAIVGGGTAGWMTALLLSNSKFGARLRVTVLDAPTAEVVGLDEGSTPWLRGFFDSLGIDEAAWMPACDATCKSGIAFEGWSTRPGHQSWFHPFPSILDSLTLPPFLRNVHARLTGADVHAHPDRFFMSRSVALEGRAPRPAHAFPFELGYGYHVDATRLGAFLRAKALERGVVHVARPMHSATRDERGDICSLELDGGDRLAADFFVDCSGFASLLLGKALETPYLSFSTMLFNDAAIEMPTPDDDGPLMSQTVSTGMKHGWAWRFPLTSRNSNGYVYSGAHVSADAAETELRTHLGLLGADVPARHHRMRVGRHARHWSRNCVAIGASQGFIEPLQGTVLQSAQRAAASFVDVLERGDLGDAARAAFNDGLNARMDGERDYIVAHYKTNTRTDTDYWRANAANSVLSEPLQLLLRTWLSSQPIEPGIEGGAFGTGYAASSWYCLLAGVGLFPQVRRDASAAGADLAGIDNFIQRSTPNFPDHRAWLRDIPSHAERIDLRRQPADGGRRATLGAL